MASSNAHIRSGSAAANIKAEAASPAFGHGQWTGEMASNDSYSMTPPSGTPTASGQASAQPQQHAVDKRRLQVLISGIDPLQQVDEDAESCLLDIADDFIDTVLNAACQVAKHRKSSHLEVRDVQYVLESQFNLWIPGFGGITDTKQAYKRPAPNDAHKQRVAMIKKIFKTH